MEVASFKANYNILRGALHDKHYRAQRVLYVDPLKEDVDTAVRSTKLH